MTPISDRLARASLSNAGRADRDSADTPELFVYGTLVLDPVVRALLARIPASEAASAPGWRAAALPERPYPGLVPDQTTAAPGRVFTDLTADEWATLNAFEDPTYDVVPVDLNSGRRALAYVWPEASLPQTWTPETLDGDRLRSYLERCSAWQARYQSTA